MAKRMNDIDHHVATRLIAARKAAGLSQTEAAESLGLTFQQVQKYERASNRISAGKLYMLAGLYGKPVEWFFDGAQAPVTERSDPAATLLALPGGATLARHFISLTDDKRRIIVTVAQSLEATRAALAKAEGR